MLDGKSFDDPTGKHYVGNEGCFLQRYWMNRDPRFEDCILYNAALYPIIWYIDWIPSIYICWDCCSGGFIWN